MLNLSVRLRLLVVIWRRQSTSFTAWRYRAFIRICAQSVPHRHWILFRCTYIGLDMNSTKLQYVIHLWKLFWVHCFQEHASEIIWAGGTSDGHAFHQLYSIRKYVLHSLHCKSSVINSCIICICIVRCIKRSGWNGIEVHVYWIVLEGLETGNHYSHRKGCRFVGIQLVKHVRRSVSQKQVVKRNKSSVIGMLYWIRYEFKRISLPYALGSLGSKTLPHKVLAALIIIKLSMTTDHYREP